MERNEQSKKLTSSSHAAIAGGIAGATSRFVAAPLDLIKIRLQVQRVPTIKSSSLQQHLPKYFNILQTMKSVYQEEGLRSFWRGNLAATQLWVSYSAMQFGSYQKLSSTELLLWNKKAEKTSQWRALANGMNGALAGIIACFVTYPLDLFRTVFASQGVPKPFPTHMSLFTHIYRVHNIRGFYSGVSITLFQIAPYVGLSFGIYAEVSEALKKLDQSQSLVLRTTQHVGAGAISGLFSKLIVYPLDTIKKRMQTRSLLDNRCNTYGAPIPAYKTSWECAKDLVVKEGAHALYKGVLPSVLKSIVSHSSMFASYETALLILKHYDE